MFVVVSIRRVAEIDGVKGMKEVTSDPDILDGQ